MSACPPTGQQQHQYVYYCYYPTTARSPATTTSSPSEQNFDDASSVYYYQATPMQDDAQPPPPPPPPSVSFVPSTYSMTTMTTRTQFSEEAQPRPAIVTNGGVVPFQESAYLQYHSHTQRQQNSSAPRVVFVPEGVPIDAVLSQLCTEQQQPRPVDRDGGRMQCFYCGAPGHKAIHCPQNPRWCGEMSGYCHTHGKVRSMSSLRPHPTHLGKLECMGHAMCRRTEHMTQHMNQRFATRIRTPHATQQLQSGSSHVHDVPDGTYSPEQPHQNDIRFSSTFFANEPLFLKPGNPLMENLTKI
eukprot:PhM_4_TR16105/c1_g4_i8/m.28525